MTWGSWELPDPGWERESKPQDLTFFTMGEGRVDISLSLRPLFSGREKERRGRVSGLATRGIQGSFQQRTFQVPRGRARFGAGPTACEHLWTSKERRCPIGRGCVPRVQGKGIRRCQLTGGLHFEFISDVIQGCFSPMDIQS